MPISLTWAAAVLLEVCALAFPSYSQTLNYPKTRKTDHVDVYHGVRVPDPYHWLEDDRSEETARWVESENRLTFDYLSRIPYRAQIRKRLEQLYSFARYSPPMRRGDYFIFGKNDGLQNQDVLYIQKGLDGDPEVLIDPNKLSDDGTTRLVLQAWSRDGRYFAFGISSGGSDWEEARVMEVATRKVLDDRVQWIKASDLAWADHGFFYSRYDAPAGGHVLSSKNENHKVYYHRVGTPQSQDELVYQDAAHPQRFHFLATTEDERFAILTVADRGAGKDGNSLFYCDLSKPRREFLPIVSEITNDSYEVIDNVKGGFLVDTNHGAPNHKVMRFDIADSSWATVIPEKPEPATGVTAAGGRLFVNYLKDVTSRVQVYSPDGKPDGEIGMPGAGTAQVAPGNHDDREVFYTFTSLSYPRTIFRYDLASHNSAVFRAPKIPGFDAAQLETKQVFYTSKDGTRIPMFLVYRKGLKLDGSNPTLLYGYGGFNVTLNPQFEPMRLALIEHGFVYAVANLRGGGEYGEKWHQAGMKLHKQNVFDDFIAAAQWLIAQGYTSPAKLAINGASNGGLLVGAVMNQRPDLFRAVVAQVGVMDMLRFQKFTIGWNWISDYGSSDNIEEFRALYAYSPLHNIRPGVKYPATLITTADHDDRVVPAHSFKYAATLQEKASPDNPVLIRIDTKSGHGSSSMTKTLDLAADMLSFVLYNLGVTI